jgi:NADH dehydrogenase [ubiquinone] 1 alpha subcomplex assembly factor 7
MTAPSPNPAFSNPLVPILTQRIQAMGALTLADYMTLCLQHPEHGYYRMQPPIGAQGDFITAPEISQMFGELIGLWCVDVWDKMGRPSPFILLEPGPGRGTLMADALRAAKLCPDFLAAMRLYLLDSNALLRQQQAEKLAAYHPHWIDRLADLPPLPLILIANEFLDALPIRQFERTPKGWAERCVTLDAKTGQLVLTLAPPSPEIAYLIPDLLQSAPVGSITERSPAISLFLQDVTHHLSKLGGTALMIDYGYIGPATKDSFRAFSQHKLCSPFADPGLADLTADVDFSLLGDAATITGIQSAPPVCQRDFLRALGIEARAHRLMTQNPAESDRITAALHRLLDPSEMGTRFLVGCLSSPSLPPLAGFDDHA